MSLESHGSSFNISVELNHEQKKVLTTHPAQEITQPLDLENLTINVEVNGNSVVDKRVAFLHAMWEFSNSPQFNALTYNLEDHFQIKVQHSINLSMPT